MKQSPIDRPGLPENRRPFAEGFLRAVNAGLYARHIAGTMRIAVLADRVLIAYFVARLSGQRFGPCDTPNYGEESAAVKAGAVMADAVNAVALEAGPVEACERMPAEALDALHESHRKAMREFEEVYARQGDPLIGIADRMKPMLKKTEGLMEELYAEAERQEVVEKLIAQENGTYRREPGDPIWYGNEARIANELREAGVLKRKTMLSDSSCS